jgi:DNA-binding NarL/FixJ family response regulator
MRSIIIADDHPFTLMGTRSFVESLGYNVLDVCSSGIAAYNSIIAREPTVALLDMSMPGMNAIEILEKLQKNRSPTKIVVLTMHNEISIFNRARELGVKGYVLKEFATKELQKCLQEVFNNKTWFSPELSTLLILDEHSGGEALIEKLTISEKKILEMISEQHTTKAIAKMLFITEKTVENHRSSIIKKLNLPPEKNALLIWAMKNGSGQTQN